MADAVLYHHESVDRVQEALPLVKIIYIANILCPDVDMEKGVKFKITEDVLGLVGSELEETALQAQEEVNEIARSLDIEIEQFDISDKAVSDKDHKKQEDLIREVKDISLLQGTLQNLLEAYSEDSILKVVQQGLQVLFDTKHVLFFLYDSERDILAGRGITSNKQNDLINEVVIPFQKGKSLLVKSLRQGTPLDSFSDSTKANLAIIDEQLIRLIGKEGILCLPMIAHKQYVGVIVIGTDGARASHLSKRIKLLTMFTKQAALALHANYLIQNQARLIQSQRLKASSTMARKVVHEANTPLSIIKNYLKILERKSSVENLEELRIINEEIDRVAIMLGKLSDFSEPKVQPTDRLDINALLSEVIRILQESLLLSPNIDLHLNPEPLLPKVTTDKNSLKQVFINLIKNAVEAMPEGGNLYISTRHASNNLLHDINGDSGYVEVLISDDGPGIPNTMKSRLFEPFVTSKGEGHAGLGLSIVYNIVKELRGTITCESEEKKGTSFKIVLPIAF
jgi:signal transduction histidine kinase